MQAIAIAQQLRDLVRSVPNIAAVLAPWGLFMHANRVQEHFDRVQSDYALSLDSNRYNMAQIRHHIATGLPQPYAQHISYDLGLTSLIV